MKLKMTLKQIRVIIIVLILMVLSGGAGFWLGQHQWKISLKKTQPKVVIERKIPPEKQEVNFSLFWEVWDRLETSYLDKKALDPAKMVYGAITGMVSALGDPYTAFLPPSEQKQSKEDLSGAFEGVGIQLGYKDSKLAVIAPLKGTPANRAGVRPGDLILKIRDQRKNIDRSTEGISLPEAVTLIRGERGTLVFLTLFREGQKEPWEVQLTRETIVVKSVELDFKDGVAHLRLLRFGERTYQEWDEAVNQISNFKLQNSNFKGVVFDLRNNPGGFLQGAVFIGSEFLDGGVVVQQEQSRNGGTQSFSVDRKGKLVKIPLVVLVNQGSASASEIVAGALQERGRAKLVGEKTFGKGTIQEAQELTGGAGLHVTIARWLLPFGKSIDKEGIKPDLEIKMDEKDSPRFGEAGQTKDPQLEKAVEILNSKL